MGNDARILLSILGLTVVITAFIIVASVKGRSDDPLIVNRGGRVLGDAQAQNTLVEFSDFFCPACKEIEPAVDRLLKRHPQDIKFVYRHFPLPQHKLSPKAAQAAEAAALQGRFWPFKERLFAGQEKLNESSFENIAAEIGLDATRFKKDMESVEVREKVETDLNDARRLNLDGTPSFFLNGKKLVLTSGNFVELVESLLLR